MTHDLFGKLKYREGDEQWVGYARLPLFATLGVRPPEPPPTEEQAGRLLADMNAALRNMRELMREKFGDRIDAAFDQWDKEADGPQEPAEEAAPDPREQERERKREERLRKRAARLAKGHFPVGVGAAPGAGPSEKQAASLAFVAANEKAVFDAVTGRVWDSFRTAYDQEHWRLVADVRPAASVADLAGRFAVTRADFTREARGGFAHVVFHVDADWQDEHGLMVVYSPDTRQAEWTTWDGLYDLVESDDPADQPGEYVPSPHDELLEAILTADEARARELVAAGADLNALADGECPPLWAAVDQMEVEEVRRMLAFGADPTLVDPDEKTTPLEHAKKLYRDLGFAPSKKKDALLEGILSMARANGAEQFDDMKRRLDEIIRLLEAATGK